MPRGARHEMADPQASPGRMRWQRVPVPAGGRAERPEQIARGERASGLARARDRNGCGHEFELGCEGRSDHEGHPKSHVQHGSLEPGDAAPGHERAALPRRAAAAAIPRPAYGAGGGLVRCRRPFRNGDRDAARAEVGPAGPAGDRGTCPERQGVRPARRTGSTPGLIPMARARWSWSARPSPGALRSARSGSVVKR